ncbi:MAG: putative bifunctional diguanylate cyclase/phosphodiesterase [Phormidesmis sp.]
MRLSKLQDYNILDTPGDAAYDDIAELAAHICEAPIALVSFVGAERQWFKAKIGLDATESPRDIGFCTHTIQQKDVLIVEDTHQSAQFQNNPLVTGAPHVRFYAGAPLVTPDGYALGSLCVVDRVPRKINHHQKQALQVLSRQVIAQMELARHSQQLKLINASLEQRVAERTVGLTSALQRLLVTQNKLQKRESALRHSALHDPLTGLPNRSYFAQRLEQAIQLANREQNHLYAVLFIDLDNFKPVNDTLGHEVGDRLLQHVANQIKLMLRKSDLVARLGGDEFAVLLDDIPNQEHAIAAVQRLQAQLKQPFEAENNLVFVSASIGITFSTQGYRQPEAALRDADIAMYHAKNQIKQRTQKLLDAQLQSQNQKDLGPLKSPILIQEETAPIAQQFAVFDATLKGDTEARSALEDELRHAILTDQFEIYYQPIFRLPKANASAPHTPDRNPNSDQAKLKPDDSINDWAKNYWAKHLIGFEALLRWHHPQRGCLKAEEFIAVAEEIGIIRQLCEQTIQTACLHLKQWQRHTQRNDLKMHVNLSFAEIQCTKLISHWQAALNQHQLPSGTCRAEVNEQLVLSGDPTISKKLTQLKALGLELCINDFGRGHSSLSRLHQLDISCLKIDRTFTQKSDESGNTDIIKTILDLGRSIDVDVIAEGIETVHQLETLTQLGCTLAQGFWLSEPLTAQAVEAHLTGHS